MLYAKSRPFVLSFLIAGAGSIATAAPGPRVGNDLIESCARSTPEHRLTLLDVEPPLDAWDPRLDEARALLAQVDAVYEEDPRRVVELIEFFCRKLRAEGLNVSGLEMLEGSLQWRNAAWFQAGNRSFELYVVLYVAARENAPAGRGRMSHRRTMRLLRTTPIPKWAEK